MVADQVAHLAHLNARDTTLVFVSRAPQADIARLKARMGWEMPWYTITDSFDADFGVDEWHGTNVFFRDGERVFRTYFINNRGDEAMGSTWSYLDITPLGRQEVWEDSPEGYPQTPPYKWWNWHDNYVAEPRPTRSGSRCRTPERPRSGTATQARRHERGLSRRTRPAARAATTRAPRPRSAQPTGWPRGRADLRDHGAADGRSRRRPDGYALLGRACVSAERNGPDVLADERLPFGALAEADLRPTKRCPPLLIRGPPNRTVPSLPREPSQARRGVLRAGSVRRRMNCAAMSRVSETASTTVPMALISGVTPRRIEEKT